MSNLKPNSMKEILIVLMFIVPLFANAQEYGNGDILPPIFSCQIEGLGGIVLRAEKRFCLIVSDKKYEAGISSSFSNNSDKGLKYPKGFGNLNCIGFLKPTI